MHVKNEGGCEGVLVDGARERCNGIRDRGGGVSVAADTEMELDVVCRWSVFCEFVLQNVYSILAVVRRFGVAT